MNKFSRSSSFIESRNKSQVYKIIERHEYLRHQTNIEIGISQILCKSKSLVNLYKSQNYNKRIEIT